jgi:hypothetical protein
MGDALRVPDTGRDDRTLLGGAAQHAVGASQPNRLSAMSTKKHCTERI